MDLNKKKAHVKIIYFCSTEVPLRSADGATLNDGVQYSVNYIRTPVGDNRISLLHTSVFALK